MSETLTFLCSALLKEYFGEIVQQVGTFLLKQVSACPLIVIASQVKSPASKVRTSLLVLIQHNLCEFSESERGFVEYKVKHQDVLRLLYYPHYAYAAHSMFGNSSDLLVEEILNHGKLTMSEALQKVVERLEEAKETTNVGYSIPDLHGKFCELVKNYFLVRCPYPQPTANLKVPKLGISELEKFIIPEIQLHLLEPKASDDEQPAKKQKTEFHDIGIYWKLNFDRFQQLFRDDAIISACSNQLGDRAASVVKSMLRECDFKIKTLAPTTHSIAFHDILKKLNSNDIVNQDPISKQEMEGHLVNLCEGTRSFVSKADDRGNGMYVVNFTNILSRVVEEMATSVIEDSFGSKCARIFNILLDKKVLEPKQIEELAMLHPKDTKEHIFKMIEDNYFLCHELPKGSDFSSSQIFYLLRVDMDLVCRTLLERCYQATFNLITCSEGQYQENKRLLEKKQRIDAIVASLKMTGAEQEQIDEVQQIISQPEEAVINKYTEVSTQFDSSSIQLAEMISVLRIWLDYSKVT